MMMIIINFRCKKNNRINLQMNKDLGMIMMIYQNSRMRKVIIIKKIIMREIKEIKIRVMIMEDLMIIMTEDIYVCLLCIYIIYY